MSRCIAPLLLGLALASCGESTSPGSGRVVVSTAAAVFTAQLTANEASVVIPYRITNGSPLALYVPRCVPPALERRTATGEWMNAWDPAIGCPGLEPLRLAPGRSFEDTLRVYGSRDSTWLPAFDVPAEGAEYRLRTAVFTRNVGYDIPDSDDLLDMDQRVSATFRIER